MRNARISGLLLTLTYLASTAAAQNLNELPSVKEIIDQARTAAGPAPLPAVPQNARTAKEWTIMVFMNGKNSLSSYIIKDMNEMEKFGPTDNINIVTQAARIRYIEPTYPSGGIFNDIPGQGPFGPYTGLPPIMRGSAQRDPSTDWFGIRRYLVTADGDDPALSSTLLADMGTMLDMGDYRELVEFGKWAKQNFPAKKYMLVVWNHGSGWRDETPGRTMLKGISYDDDTHNGISTVELGRAVREIGGLDIYASDACLMQMAEVVYELKDAAKIVIGSEDTEPGDGWAYDYFLARVHSNRNNLTSEIMAAAAVQGFKAFHAENNKPATLSAVYTSGIRELKTMLDRWAELVMLEDKKMVKEALIAATGFRGVGSRDLIHFINNVQDKTASEELKALTATVTHHVLHKVILDNAATGDKFKQAYGLAIYLPAYGYTDSYEDLPWSREGKWDDFAKWITSK